MQQILGSRLDGIRPNMSVLYQCSGIWSTVVVRRANTGETLWRSTHILKRHWKPLLPTAPKLASWKHKQISQNKVLGRSLSCFSKWLLLWGWNVGCSERLYARWPAGCNRFSPKTVTSQLWDCDFCTMEKSPRWVFMLQS